MMDRFDATRLLMVLTFATGLLIALIGMADISPDFGMIGAFVIEGLLLACSISRITLSRNEVIFSIVAVTGYIGISLLLEIFSFYVVMASIGFAIFITLSGEMTESIFIKPLASKLSSTRLFLVGIYAAGFFYAVFATSTEGASYGTIVAIILEFLLLVGSITQGALDKKGLGLFSVAIFAYLLFSFLFGDFSEVVVMAAAGMTIYAGLMSEPKFPLTKRAVGTGIIVGVVMTFLGIYLALKLGIVYFVGAELLGFLLLSLNGRYTPEENTISVAIANTSSMVSVGVLITFPAIAIFGPTQMPWLDVSTIITFEFIAIVTGLSAIFGLLLLAPFRKNFEDDPWPQVRPQAETINSLGADSESKRTVMKGLTVSAAYVGSMKAIEAANDGLRLSSIPHAFTPAVPDWIGVTNSPLMGAIGFFVGWKRVLTMFIGSVVSIFFWIVLERALPMEYADHLTRPEILYLAIGIFITVIVGDIFSGKEKDDETQDEQSEEEKASTTDDIMSEGEKSPKLLRVQEEILSLEVFKEEIRFMVRDPRGYLLSTRGHVPIWVAGISMALFILIGTLIFGVIRPFAGIEVPILLFVLGSPIAMLSAYFTARSISETGMLAGYISDMISIPAILLFRISFAAITTFMAMLGALQDSAIALLVHLKLGTLTGVRGRDIAKGVFVGALLGTFVGSLITFMLYSTYGFGGTEFPAPAAQLFGFLVVSLTGLSNFQLPGLDTFPDVHPLLSFTYLLIFGIIGFLAGRELSKRNLSPISLAVGILVPPATTIAMLFGGYMDYRLKKEGIAEKAPDPTETPKYRKWVKILSGVIAGEAIVTVIWVLYNALLMFMG
ncbi:MAG: OPT/YSL family transporter [Candidatus Thorarchaeota archaeon]